MSFLSTDNALPYRLGKSTKRRGTETDGLARKIGSGTGAQEFNSQGLIPPDISQASKELQVLCQNLQVGTVTGSDIL